MNTLYLQYILTVADCGSINKASQKLQLKQQYLSHVIKSLEDEFSIQIFHRHPRGVQPTADGELFLSYAKQITFLVDKMHLQYQYPSKQSFYAEKTILNLYAIPAMDPINLSQSIVSYRKLFPQVTVNYIESYLEDSIPYILHEPCAISIQTTNLSMEQLKNTLPEELKIVTLCPITLTALTSWQNVTEQKITAITLQQLLQKELIFFAPKGLENSIAYQVLSNYGTPHIAFSAENYNVFSNLLENDNYFTIGLAKIAKDNPKIVSIPITDYEDVPMYAIAIIRNDLETLPIVRDFLNIIRLQLGQATT